MSEEVGLGPVYFTQIVLDDTGDLELVNLVPGHDTPDNLPATLL